MKCRESCRGMARKEGEEEGGFSPRFDPSNNRTILFPLPRYPVLNQTIDSWPGIKKREREKTKFGK